MCQEFPLMSMGDDRLGSACTLREQYGLISDFIFKTRTNE